MIEIFRHIIVSVTAAALLGSVLISITEGGAHREIVRIAVGLMLILALINPLKSVRIPKLKYSFDKQPAYYDGQKAYEEAVLKEFIRQTQSYIQNKAKESGIICTIKLYAKQKNSEISFSSAEISAEELTDSQEARLRRIISEQCGISPDNIAVIQVEK